MACQLTALLYLFIELVIELVDVVRAMLYGDTTFNSWWSGEEMFKL